MRKTIFKSLMIMLPLAIGFCVANAAREPSVQIDGSSVIRRVHMPAGGSYWSFGRVQQISGELQFEMSCVAWDGANSCQWHVSSSLTRVLPLDQAAHAVIDHAENVSGLTLSEDRLLIKVPVPFLYGEVVRIQAVTSTGFFIVESPTGKLDVIATQRKGAYERAITNGSIPGVTLKISDRVQIKGVLFGTQSEIYRIHAFSESGSVICIQAVAESHEPPICLKSERVTLAEGAN